MILEIHGKKKIEQFQQLCRKKLHQKTKQNTQTNTHAEEKKKKKSPN